MLDHKTRFLYDTWGNIKEAIQPDGSKSSFEHDEKGNSVTIVDSLGAKQKLEYDKLDRCLKFVYDEQEQITSIINESGESNPFGNQKASNRS